MDNKKLLELFSVGQEKGHTLYDICFRQKGVGIKWFCEDGCMLDPSSEISIQWQEAAQELQGHGFTYIDNFYPTLNTAIEEEIKRLTKNVNELN